ncbi:hypothetical protein BX286_5615 [Streptomyces sp. 3211.6]|uniref:hypothetical protein n=1 Tax=Streptomyces sp. 3211.6 TaxID=1938845 RepID=UPI000F13D105|nr:hypothetical protein [Streptomyces sp. 3211.6]RKT07552.1 hypothetical protein BX286_5615 [Streptomyces sp. 3211.6]
MKHDDRYWRQTVERFSRLTNEMAAADVNEIWNYGPPNPGATPTEIGECREIVPGLLVAGHVQLLTVANGWPGFYHDVDLFGTDDFIRGEKLQKAWELLEAADQGSGGLLSIDRAKFLPIAAAQFDIDCFVLGLETGVVRWIAGQEIETFPSIAAFVEGMIRYNEETLTELRVDPWLGAG